jgi:hypothetical protein
MKHWTKAGFSEKANNEEQLTTLVAMMDLQKKAKRGLASDSPPERIIHTTWFAPLYPYRTPCMHADDDLDI